MKMKKRYTKKQIVESIKYWQSRLADLNESELSYDSLDDVYGDIVDNIMPQDRALSSKLMKLYQREFPGGKRSDDEFTEWTLDLIGPVFDRVMEKQLKSGIEQVLSAVKAIVDKQLKGGKSKKIDESQQPIDFQLKKTAEDFLTAQLRDFTKKYKSISGWGKNGVGYPARTDWICDTPERAEELADALKKSAKESKTDLRDLASYVRYAYIAMNDDILAKLDKSIDSKVREHFQDILPYAFDNFCSVDIGRPDSKVINAWW